ncbi:MAG: uL15 family ribosomal protein [Clostridia bacterium]|nr:uL15 family ribosomal protein [Clostridia bacterium]
MKTLFLEIPPAALYVIIAACAIIVVAGIAVAAYLYILEKREAKSAQPAEDPLCHSEQSEESPEPADEQTVQQEEEPVPEIQDEPDSHTEPVCQDEPLCHSEHSEESPEAVDEQPEEADVPETAEEQVPVQPEQTEELEAEEPATEEEQDEPDDEDDKNEEEDETEVAPVRQVARTANGHVRYIIIKYNKSFTAKLIQSADLNKDYYSTLKNELLSYKGVKSRTSWKYETFYAGRQTFARLSMRGKKLCLFLALDPKNYVDTKYIIDDKSEVLAYEKTPLMYRIKNDRRVKFSKELIATVMDGREKAEEYAETNYAAQLPYEEIEPLIERKLVKVLTEEDAQSGDVFKPRDFVEAAEVNELLQDDIAQALIEVSDEVSDRTKCEIINVDILSRYFENDEKVTLEEIKKRVPKFPKNATYIKVLARGLLNKRLTVVADAYSLEAAKMILLTGGNPVKKR